MRSTTFCLLFEGMLNVGAGSFNVYMLSMLNALLNVGVYMLLFTCKTHIGVMLQFLTVFFLVVELGLVMVKVNSHRPARLNSATVGKW